MNAFRAVIKELKSTKNLRVRERRSKISFQEREKHVLNKL